MRALARSAFSCPIMRSFLSSETMPYKNFSAGPRKNPRHSNAVMTRILTPKPTKASHPTAEISLVKVLKHKNKVMAE